MKRHGLWQFHRSLHERGPHLKWWTPEEVEQAFRRYDMVSGHWLSGAFIQSPYRKMDVVIRCANRYIRRYGLKRNVETWNSVCTLICRRMKAHSNTMKAVIHSPINARPLTPLHKDYRSEFDLPYPRHSAGEILQRLKSIKQMQRLRQEKLESICCICQEKEGQISSYLWNDDRKLLGLDELLQDRPSYKCCETCFKQLGKLLKKAKAADECRLSIQRFKRKQYESTKNNARTA